LEGQKAFQQRIKLRKIMTKAETKNESEPLVDEVDLEEYAKAGKPPSKAQRYRIRIDDKRYVVTQSSMTGREILVLAGKTPPESFILTQKQHGGALHTVGLDDVVDFTKPGIERFNTLPRQVQEG
jgi:hypothetical protein